VIDQLLQLHNDFRKAHGSPAFAIAPALMVSAKRESDDCARTNRLSHTSSDGASPFQRMTSAGYRYTWAGENIAMGQEDAPAVCRAWESDIPHRANMLNSKFRDVGFAVSYDRFNRPYWTADFGSTTMMMQGELGYTAEGFEDYPNQACAFAYRPPSDD
jgi:uncharacterized protein YkwD